MNINYSREVFRKTFENRESSKQCYLDACKWLAKNVYGSESYSEKLVVKIKKQESKVERETRIIQLKNGKEKQKTVEVQVYRFEIVLYYQDSLTNSKDVFCNNCNQAHNTFFGDNPKCSDCRFKVFWKRLDFESGSIVDGLSKSFTEVENG